MKLEMRGFAFASAALWSAALLLTALMNVVWKGYAQEFLNVIASIYPGYHAGHSVLQVVLVTAEGYVDGLVWGAIFCWVYNRMMKNC